MLTGAEKHNFDMLGSAFANKDVAMMECRFKESGDRVPVICITVGSESGILMMPVALLLTFDPFESLVPPDGAETIDINQNKERPGSL